MWNSLRFRLTTVFIVLAIGPLVLVGLVLARSSLAVEREQALDLQRQVAHRVSSEVDAFLREVERDLLLLGAEVREFEQREQAQPVLRNALNVGRYQNVYKELTFLDGQGKEQVRLSKLITFVAAELGDRSGADEFEQPKASGKTYYSPVWFDPTTGRPLITVAIPLSEPRSTQVGHVLVADLRARAIGDLMASVQVGEGQTLYVVDAENQVIAHQDTSMELHGKRIELPEQADTQTGLGGKDVVLAVDRIQLGEQEFIIVAERPTSEALRQATDTIITIVVTVVLAFVIAGGLAFLFVRQIVRPIEALASTAQAISAGDLSLRTQVARRDEVGNLAETFNSMTAQLHDLVGSLEQRVAERTAELEKSGQALAARGQELENALAEGQQRTLELEEATRRQVEANRELRIAHNQSRVRAARLQASAVVSRVITREHDMDKLLPQVTELISRRFGFYHVAVFLTSANDRATTLRAANSAGGRRMLAQGYKLEITASNVVGRAIRSGEPCIGLDVGEGAVSFDIPELPDTRSEVALPLRTGDMVIGVLDVHSVEPSAFDEEDVVTLSTLADQVAIAIENARLMRQAQEALEEAEAVYSQMLMGQWEGLTRKRRFSPGEYVQALAPSPDDVPLVAAEQAMKRGKVVAISGADSNDAETPGVSELAAPIQLQGQTIGVLDLQELEGERHWTQDDVILIQEVADQVGQALEKARLFDESRRRAHREQSTRQITDRIRGRTEVDAMLQTAIRELAQTLRAPRVFVRLVPELLADSDERQTHEKPD